MNRVVVIGGGIVGASAAFHLSREGIETILVDRKDKGHATAAGAGIIAPGTSQRPLPEFYPFAAIAVRYYPQLVAELAELGCTDTGYEVVGELVLALDDGEMERLQALLPLFRARFDQGMPNLGDMSMIDDGEARQLFPLLGPISGGVLVPEAARVDGDFLRSALIAGAQASGARITNGSASLRVDDAAMAGVELNGESIEADAVVIAAGAWTNAILEPLGHRFAVEPQRGQILHLSMPGKDTGRWPILGGFSDQYILTFGPDRIVAGATREHGSGFDVRTTAGGLQSVLNQAHKVAPGLHQATVVEVRIGLRPLSADGLPYLGKVPEFDNVVVATGHGPSGLQLGPYSGQVAAQLVLEQAVEADLAPFAIDRPIMSMA